MLIVAFGTRMESACCRGQAPALIVVCNRAAMKLRLMEQACGCSTVRGGQAFKVCARLCLWHSDGECLPPRPGTGLQCGLQRSRHEAPTGLKVRATS